MLGLSVVALGAVILYASTGQLGKVVASVGSSMAGLVGTISSSPSPSTSAEPLSGSPTLIAPEEPYTNETTADLSGAVPTAIAGRLDYRVRIYQALKGQAPTLIREITLGQTASFAVPGVILLKGVNLFTAALVGPAGESPPSPAVTYVYDTSKPKIAITSPAGSSTVNASTVELVGTTQQRSVVVAHNEANGASATGKAGPDGTFRITLALEPGVNNITVVGTDPAGNSGQAALSLLRGNGRLTATLTPSAYQFQSGKLPASLTLTALVTDPDGHPLEGTSVTFTVSIPGIEPVTQDGTTDGAGSAVFQTSVPKAATPGNGLATVLVTTKKLGTTSARAVFVIAK